MKPKRGRKTSFTRIKGKLRAEKKNGNSVLNEELGLPFAIGDEVLACWQDGLYYLAFVKTVDIEKSRCQVSFEDDSVYWVLFRHIRTVPENKGEISCFICGKTESTDQGDIIVCDGCFYGYHQKCHTPAIDEDIIKNIESGNEWLCRVCVFCKAAKAGGAVKSGPDGNALKAMKVALPYDLSLLHWDGYHKFNTDETYCYCAGPGLWYYKMLKCYTCHQWFHEACLQCLDFPLLLGDRFYFFVCAVCNDGEEYLKRIQLKWSDIAALVLYNLSLKHDKRQFKNMDIELFLEDHWDDLQCGNLHDTPENERMARVTDIFKQQKTKFRSICVNGNDADKTWSFVSRAAPGPSKTTLLHEAQAKNQSEMTARFLDWNGNYLQAANIEGNSPTPSEQEVNQNLPSTSESSTSHQTPVFPSLSMFKYLIPSCGTESPSSASACSRNQSVSELCPTAGDKRPRTEAADNKQKFEPIEKRFVNYVTRVSDGITSYSGANGRLACGEDCALLGRRLGKNGRVDYLVQWHGCTPDSF